MLGRPLDIARNFGVSPSLDHARTIWPVLIDEFLRWPSFRSDAFRDLMLIPGPWRFLEQCMGTTRHQIRSTLEELQQDELFLNHIRAVWPQCKGPFVQQLLLYTLVRLSRPAHVVETGVASGTSSAFLLRGLDRNASGTLHSIDLPNYDDGWVVRMSGRPGGVPGRSIVDNRVPEGQRSGWAVPDGLRSRWELMLSDTRVGLPTLLERVGPIDLAVHDSDHSPEAILREGTLLWSNLRRGGFLLVDDIDISDAFGQLTARLAPSASTRIGRLGVAVK